MSTLNSSSTLDEIRASYADSASYAEDGDAAKCRAYITACRLLLLHVPKRASHANRAEEVELSPELLTAEIREARRWLACYSAATAATRAVYSDFQGFRD